MKVYVVVRGLNGYSELWLKRQLNGHPLFQKVFSLGEIRDWKNKLCAERIPKFSDLPSKILRKLFPSSLIGNIVVQRNKWLAKQIAPGDSVLFHYLDFALNNFKPLIYSGQYKVFIYCHGYDITWDKVTISPYGKPYFDSNYVLNVLDLSKYAKFICNSTDTYQKLLGIGVSQDRLLVNYFGVELPAVTAKKPAIFTILYLGRLVDFKGPDLVIKAFELASEQGLKAKLVLAGDGYLRPYLELLRKRSSYKDSIELLGSVNAERAAQLLANSSIFTAHNCKGELSNQEEAFGVSIIEAMSYGLPVVTGRSGGIVDSVKDGETGIIVEPFDVEAHAAAFLKLYHNQKFYSKLSENARDLVKNKFSMEQEYDNLLNIFKNG